VLDEVDQTAGVVEDPVLDLLRFGGLGRLLLSALGRFGVITDDVVDDLVGGHPLVGQLDGEALVEERHLLQSPGDRLEVVAGGLEDVRVGPEANRRAGLLGLLTLFESARHRTIVGLKPLVPVRADVGLKPGGQRVDHRHTHTVQTTGHLVGALFELSAGMQDGHHDVDGRDAGGVHGDRNATTVVGDLDAAVLEDPHIDLGREAGHRLVDGVVDDLPDQVMKTAFARRADVHARPLADRFEPLEDLDRIRAVLGRSILLLGSHVGRVSSGFAGERSTDRRVVPLQSTGRYRQDRRCGGVFTYLSAPCAEFLELRCVGTPKRRPREPHAALSAQS
jgi:hypothetical protein